MGMISERLSWMLIAGSSHQEQLMKLFAAEASTVFLLLCLFLADNWERDGPQVTDTCQNL